MPWLRVGSATRSRSGFRLTSLVPLVEVLVVADRLATDAETDVTRPTVICRRRFATPAAMALRSSDLLNQLRAEVAIKEHQANHDALTGLANRTLFAESVDDALDTRKPNSTVGVMIIDLDGFKSLNDSFGHEAGDSMLLHLSECLTAMIGDRGTVARLGGDVVSSRGHAARARSRCRDRHAWPIALLSRPRLAYPGCTDLRCEMVHVRDTSIGVAICHLFTKYRGPKDPAPPRGLRDVSREAAWRRRRSPQRQPEWPAGGSSGVDDRGVA